MKLDRELQKKILEKLAEHYPTYYPDRINDLDDNQDKETIEINLHYLREHGLIEGLTRAPIGQHETWFKAKITARGADFLQDDGGLSAILGAVTVRLHADTIKDLVEARINGSTMPEPEKKRFIDTIRSLPAEATKHLTMKLIDMGLGKVPSIEELMRLTNLS